MRLCNMENRTETLIRALCTVWEKSAKATHLFLSEQEILKIAAYIPAALREITHLTVAFNDENEPIAFMGIDGAKLEMLFIAPEERGKGLGKQLLQYGIATHAIREVCVNEQNPNARGFYEHMGFTVYKRTDCDEQGNPYPLLYLQRAV